MGTIALGQNVFLGVVIGASVLLFLILAFLVYYLAVDPNKIEEPKHATLTKFWRHEHPLLSIIWSGPVVALWPKHFMTRGKRLAIFIATFFLNFIVAGIIYSVSKQQSVEINCGLLAQCHAGCAAPCHPSKNPYVSPIGAGESYTLASTAPQYFLCGGGKNATVSDGRVCWPKCRPEGAAVEQFDNRQDCSVAPSEDLLCLDPKEFDDQCGISGSTDPLNVQKVLNDFNYIEIAERIALTILIVLPFSFIMKRLFRVVYFSQANCCGRVKASFSYLFILIIFGASVAVAILLALTLQDGQVVGTLTLSFLTSFLIGLLLDFPKLTLFYYCYKRGHYEKRYDECIVIYKQKMKEKKGSSDSDETDASSIENGRDAPIHSVSADVSTDKSRSVSRDTSRDKSSSSSSSSKKSKKGKSGGSGQRSAPRIVIRGSSKGVTVSHNGSTHRSGGGGSKSNKSNKSNKSGDGGKSSRRHSSSSHRKAPSSSSNKGGRTAPRL